MANELIVVVAPYSPPTRQGPAFLGAAHKIELVLESLADAGYKVILVNSAHQSTGVKGFIESKISVGENHISEIILPARRYRFIGKLFHLFIVKSVIIKILNIGVPRLVWVYNGYAFESFFSILLDRRLKIPIVLQFEDWHFSRKRGYNPKPYLDWIAWRFLTSRLAFSFSVNSFLAKKLSLYGVDTKLLPGLVSKEIVRMARAPFSSSERVRVGYFGGLSIEKGANIVLELAGQTEDNVEFCVTGSGPLESGFESASKTSPNFHFYGRVAAQELAELIASCDVIINPHSSIHGEMGGGIFPFKVIEAISSGRLVVSTELPQEGLADVLDGVYFVEPSAKEFLNAIKNARLLYGQRKSRIDRAAALAIERFGQEIVGKSVAMLIEKG